ncbi:MAG: D-alanyl-D-alanine carboxypeptidase family protein [Oscillospiraceae bacterium]|nr:D-alanyl-D-alanine carboxypeptidase family protein [Oscillospiraceae bacterium]
MKSAIGLEYGEHDGGAGMGYRTFYQASYDVATGGLQVNQENGYWARTLGAYSEHCAGLAVDFNISYNSSEFIESTGAVNREGTAPANKEFTWLADNAHKYGFIWRYKIDGDTTSATGQRTGTIYEGWHWRFVGVYNATKFWEKCAADTDGDGILDKGYMTNDNYVWEDYYNEYIANDSSYPHSEYEAFTGFYNAEAGNKCTYEEYLFR